MLSTINGIPLHPLFVHAAAVFAPTAGLLVLLWAFIPSWRSKLTGPAWITSVVAAISTILAKTSGEALLSLQGRSEANPGEVSQHMQYADMMTIAVIAMTVVVLVAVFLAFKRIKESNAGMHLALRIGAGVLAIAVLVTSFLTGHEGARLVWAEKNAESSTSQDASQHSTSEAGDGAEHTSVGDRDGDMD